MTLMWMNGVSYILVRGVEGDKRAQDRMIEVVRLEEYLKAGAAGTFCPKSNEKYPAFYIAEGPECQTGHGKAADVLASALRDKKHPCRPRALELLGYSIKNPWTDRASPALIEALIGVLKDEPGQARSDAARTLRQATRHSIGQDYESWRKWWEENKQTYPPKQVE